MWLGLRFRDAVLITLVPLTLLVLVFAASVRDYLKSRLYDDWFARERTVASAFSARLHAIAGLPQSLRLRDQLPPDASDPGIIRFEVPANLWDSLEVEQPGEWAKWVETDLRYGRTVIPVRVRKRGDNSIHWLTDKRTLTVRTPRDDFYKRFQTFGLSGKEVLTSWLANHLPSEFGLLAPSTEITPVYLNDRFYGTYRFVEVVDESFLRPFDRMPGNIFRGDAAERGEYRKGAPRNLFENPYLWDRPAANQRLTSAGATQLQLLLNDVAGTTFADHERLMNRLDRDEWSRLFSYLFLVGDPFHMDAVHNQMLYEDPSTQQLHPIPWDIRILPLSAPEKPLSDLFQATLQDPFLLDAMMREIARRIEGDAFSHLVDSLLRRADSSRGRYLAYDKLRSGLVPDVGSADYARQTLRGNVALLRRWIAADTVAFAATAAGGAHVLDFETRGFVGADLKELSIDGAPVSSAPLRRDANLNGVLDASDPAVTLPLALYPGWKVETRTMRPGHMPYRLFVTGLPAGARVTPVLANRVTGAAPTLVAWNAAATIREGSAWHPWQFRTPASRVHRYAGDVRIDTTIRIAAGDTVIIAPGTTLRLGPDVSFISKGYLEARGTAAAPIKVIPQAPGVPWGTFVLLGHGADSSFLHHVEFVQGGGALVDRIEYIGMINVHRADGVVFDHNIFRENLRSDDTFHALHSRSHVRNSQFIRANSDAIDYDIASGEIINNTFDATGGDAIDLMTSTPDVIGNRITGSGDKGISIGENSSPFVFNNDIINCFIGIEVKDRSDPIILHNRITSSGTGFRERRKNWRYGGGSWPTAVLTSFNESGTAWKKDVYSRVTLANVTGLDSASATMRFEPGDLSWLYEWKGIAAPAAAAPGLLPNWSRVTPLRLLDQQAFDDDFGSVADGWVAAGGVNRLEKRRSALVIGVQREAGSASRGVRWNLPAGALLVVELAGVDLATSRVVVSGPAGRLVRSFTVHGDLAAAKFVTLRLPAGRYDTLSIELEPMPGLTEVDLDTGLNVIRGGRIDLRGYRLVPPTTRAR